MLSVMEFVLIRIKKRGRFYFFKVIQFFNKKIEPFFIITEMSRRGSTLHNEVFL